MKIEQSAVASAALLGYDVELEGDNLDAPYIEEESKGELKARKKLEQSYNERELNLTEEEQEFIDTKLSSKLWRLNHLYTIQDKDGVKGIMRLNDSQNKVLQKYKHNRKIILKSRQQGISTLFLAYYLDDCLMKPGFQAGIQSYGQDEADKLSKRAELMWNELDQDIKNLLGLKLVSNNSKGLTFSNGSILKIGNFRGDTLQGLHVSELGKIAKKYPEKAKELKTGAFQAVSVNNKITIESTAEGKSGLFYEMWTKATSRAPTRELTPLDFQPIFLSWIEDPDCQLFTEFPLTDEVRKYAAEVKAELGIILTDSQLWWLAAKKDELGEDFNQEYPATPEMAFAQSVEGTYYAHEYKKLTLKQDSYDLNLKVHSSFDLGMNDMFSIGFFQIHPSGKVKIIGEYMNNGYGLDHYRDMFLALSAKFGWVHGNTYVPHDIKVTELIAGKTRWTAMKELGFNPILVNKHRVQEGIEATRQFLKEVYIDDTCTVSIGAIQNYRKKYDAKYDVYLDAPVHDEHSHPADMLRYMAMGLKYKMISDIYVVNYRPQVATQLVSGFDV